jgi:hypothetical protein
MQRLSLPLPFPTTSRPFQGRLQRLVMMTPGDGGVAFCQTFLWTPARPSLSYHALHPSSTFDTVSDSYYAASLSPVTTLVPNCSRKAPLTHSPTSQCHHSSFAYPKSFATPKSLSHAGTGICYRTHPRYAALTEPRATEFGAPIFPPKLIQQIALFLKSK